MMTKTNALRLLDAAGIGYRTLEYDVEDGRLDARSVAEKIGEDPEQVFKTLVAVSGDGDHFVFVIPACGELNLKKAARCAGCKSIELIALKQLLPLTGYVHGGCSPVGMKKLFPTFIDETAVLYNFICVSGGRVGLNIAVDSAELAGFTDAEFADLTK